jgi:tetratricopeptide (TPR) repeat protein
MRPHPSILAIVMALLPAAAVPAVAQLPTSPAEQRIARVREAIAKNAARYDLHNELALAYARRARETGDPAFYDRASESLAASQELERGNFEAERLEIWLLLGRHQFAAALSRAKALNARVPDDVLVYGFLTDAHTALGNYAAAEVAAQWMLDLRPGNVPALTRAAYLRELFGDVEGAVELMEQAYRRTPESEGEDRAWILTQVAHLSLMTGKVDQAEKLLDHALQLFPAYHYGVAQMARVRSAQGRTDAAVDLLRQRHRQAPHPENLYELAEALERAGQAGEARRQYADFERQARAEMEHVDNANRELIFYYADRARRPAEALKVARLEAARRADIQTLDAFAWALHANGRHAEARQQIDKALAVGIRDPRLFYHAGVIAAALRDNAGAERYLRQSLDLAPRSEDARSARTLLDSLSTGAR